MEPMYCTVVTTSRSKGIGNGLTYEVEGEGLQSGSPVRVPLRNHLVEGIVMDILQKRAEEGFDLRKIQTIAGQEPLLTGAQIKTVRWMAEYYCTTLRQALGVWLPPPPWADLLPQDITGYRMAAASAVSVKGKKQIAVVEYLSGKEWVSKAELASETGATSVVLKTLLERGVIAEESRREERPEASTIHDVRTYPVLTSDQEAAYDSIIKSPNPSLLFGVTGSGKTEIYAQLIVDAVKNGGQALLLVPEILLTEQSIGRFTLLLKEQAIAVIHSKLTEAERRRAWKRIKSGAVSLVIGSRSALFTPLPRLGVIIVDEEHEWTYKNEQTPRYHVRETAEKLAQFAGARLVFGSATPSLESWARAKSGGYNLVRLPKRYRDQALPTVRVVDLAAVKFGNAYPFSPDLVDAIAVRLERKEQSVIFLNRRGVASALLCLGCRRRIICPESQLPFTVHYNAQGRPYLLDHSTGVSANVPSACPHCGGVNLHAVGAGTQKVEILLQRFFPKARLLRADSDTLQEPSQMRELLDKMKRREADILLGTQSVVKGLDLPEVTLAAVLLADLGLSLPHFRAGERVFQLLTQLTGRSGRAKNGEVIIQTFRPDAAEVMAASKHETEKYLDDELKLRNYSSYPPLTQMIRLLYRGDDASIRAKKAHAELQKIIAEEKSDTKVFAAPTFSSAGKMWHVLLRGLSPRSLLSKIDIEDAIVDVDPMETM